MLATQQTDLPNRLHTLPALFVSHGLPTLAVSKNATTDALARLGYNLPKPQAIIVMSAHWQSQTLEVSTASHLATWHDYHIPYALMSNSSLLDDSLTEKLKNFRYYAKGHPELAQYVIDLLHHSGADAHADTLHPLDHGVWAPLAHMYPNADVPIIQLSLPTQFDAYACYQLGACLHFLRERQILIMGSGNITHNLVQLNWQHTQDNSQPKKNHTPAKEHAVTFRNWLVDKLKNDTVAALDWQHAPFAKENHPTHEHLLPLFFALGTGQMVSVVHSSFCYDTLGMDIYRFD